MAAKLRKGDRVVVISGPERGHRGEITKVIRKEQCAVVASLNFSVRHRRESPGSLLALSASRRRSTCRILR